MPGVQTLTYMVPLAASVFQAWRQGRAQAARHMLVGAVNLFVGCSDWRMLGAGQVASAAGIPIGSLKTPQLGLSFAGIGFV